MHTMRKMSRMIMLRMIGKRIKKDLVLVLDKRGEQQVEMEEVKALLLEMMINLKVKQTVNQKMMRRKVILQLKKKK